METTQERSQSWGSGEICEISWGRFAWRYDGSILKQQENALEAHGTGSSFFLLEYENWTRAPDLVRAVMLFFRFILKVRGSWVWSSYLDFEVVR